ncbi:glycoside hydrolase family 51 protein [Lentithecium fluviatile CBS 122367]|uniref:non-reducing end alpha-L-arabinofuranosidase n=1 Tax=Lentithecium fluviatile CBS 122367 TaxID=1168545 RepID=A0A6G1JKI5_9PLEO|nr:glycoside hydrolase family 51 protein [Lentithecium fluviatile CBS 122367]
MKLLFLGLVAWTGVSAVDITVASTGGNVTSPIPYGIMQEDINNAGDGGIYAELIRNRAFQGGDLFPVSLEGYSPIKGIDVQKQEYKGSFYVRSEYDRVFTVCLQSALTNKSFGSVEVKSAFKGSEWVQHHYTLVPTRDAPNSNNSFVITFNSAGVSGASLDFNLISLFPPTYKGRENGLRTDPAEAFEALNPKFFRFPGGNALEGPNLSYPWKWNETIGPLKDRSGRPSAWGYRRAMARDSLNIYTVLAVYTGLGLDGGYINETDSPPWVEDALNEIEFVRGDATTPYGALHYRFPLLKDAISSKYPDIQIIASPSVFDNMTIPASVAGDYYPYREPDVFYNEFHKFDNLTDDSLTLVSEFSSMHPNGEVKWADQLHPYLWWIGGVADAIFVILMERNGDRILGSTYAPILQNMNRWQWSICLVESEADTRRTTLSTGYHVFKVISTTLITRTLPTTPGMNTSSLFFRAGIDEETGKSAFKAANYNTKSHEDTPFRRRLTLLRGSEGSYGYNDPAMGNNVIVEDVPTLKAGADWVFEWSMPELSVAMLVVDGDSEDEKKKKPRGKLC